jgi:hypothetical protein
MPLPHPQYPVTSDPDSATGPRRGGHQCSATYLALLCWSPSRMEIRPLHKHAQTGLAHIGMTGAANSIPEGIHGHLFGAGMMAARHVCDSAHSGESGRASVRGSGGSQ